MSEAVHVYKWWNPSSEWTAKEREKGLLLTSAIIRQLANEQRLGAFRCIFDQSYVLDFLLRADAGFLESNREQLLGDLNMFLETVVPVSERKRLLE